MGCKFSSKALWGAGLAIAQLLATAPAWSQTPAPIADRPLQVADKSLWRLTPALREKELESQNQVQGSARAPLSPCAIQNLDCSTSNGCPPRSCHLVVNFPETQWDICVKEAQYDDNGNNYHQYKGLAVGPVWLKRSATSAWMPILYEAGMAENFIAYHTYLFHFYDTQFGNIPQTQPMTPDDAGFGGLLLTLSQATVPTAVAECRSRGLAWFCHGQSSSVRRGEELVIWANYDTGNYDYIVEYGFRDDGTMTFRVGASGFVNANAPYDAHMHNVLWRVDMDLGGYPNDRASLIRHVETSGPFATDLKLAWNNNTGTEGVEDWNAPEFTTVLIEDVVQKNAFNHNIAYELQPLRHGTSKHFLSGELWTQHDFWVTRYHPAEETSWAIPFKTPDTYLMNAGSFPSNLESTQNGDLVVWYHSAAHHDPIDEDRWSGDSTPFCKLNPNDLTCWHGVTSFHWQGFDLVPHNLFDYNPLGGPHYCYP